MEVDIKLAENLIEAFNHEETGILLWDKNDKLLFRNLDIEKRFESLKVPFEIGTSFYDRISKIKKNKMLPNKDIETRIKNYELAKSSKKPQEMLVKGPTKRWMQVKDTLTPSGNILTLLTNVTKIVEQEEERKRLSDAIENVPSGIHFWDENNKLILANKMAKSLHKSWKFPFKLEKGVKYEDLYRSLLKYDVFTIPNGMSLEQAVQFRLKNRIEVKSGSREIELNNGSTFVASEIKLEDGSLLSIFSDVSEIKKREAEYKIISDALNTLPHGATLWDKEDRLIMANNFAYEIWEAGGIFLKPGDTYADYLALQAKHNFVNFGDMNKKEQKHYFEKVLKSRKEFKDEMTFITPPFYNGSIWQSTSTRLSNGGIFSLLTNVTEIKEKENNLQQLLDTIDQIPTIILLWDKDHKLIHSNEMAKTNAKLRLNIELKDGISRKEYVMFIIKTGLLEVPNGMKADDFIDQREKEIGALQGKQRFETTFTDGVTFAGLFNKFPDGSYIQIFDDITDLKEKENQAKLAEKRLQDAIDSMPHGISLWDKNDVLVMNNKYAYDIHKKAGIDNYLPGITFEEQAQAHKDKNFLKFNSEEEKNKYFDSAFKNRKSFTGTRTIEVPQFYDNSFWSATYTRLEDNSVFTIFSNITELKTRENELRKTISQLDDEKEKANAANKTKSQFLANMSHELRTPLNAIIGLTEMLKEDATDDGLDDFVEPLERVFNAGKHLLTLINDVLDLSKIEAGKIDLFNETFELKPIIDDIIKTSEPLASKNDNNLILKFDNKIDQITSDQTRIKQVILNLISNACKFTEKGTITLSLKKKNRTFVRNGKKMSLGDLITIEISDTGIGMSQEQMDRLFNSFVQADSSTTRKYGGTGLGLTISKQLALMMGGDVKVKSVINEGTTFVFTFLADYRDASEDTKNKKAEESSLIKNVVSIENQTTIQNKNAKTILVIDDDPTVSELIKRQLTKNASYNVVIANNGKDGLKLAKEIKPNLITLDILMPEMDGWSVLRTLKADPEVSNIPVIMASILDEKNKGFSLGASDFVSKPIEKESLLNSIENLIGKSENLKICLIEDDENLRFTIKELLQKKGNNVIEAKNGKVGIELLEKEENLPDLILLDLMMPEMNGFEFLNQIKGTKLKSIPVLVLTGADLQDEDIKFLKGETEKVIQKTDDTVLSIAEEINKVMQTVG